MSASVHPKKYLSAPSLVFWEWLSYLRSWPWMLPSKLHIPKQSEHAWCPQLTSGTQAEFQAPTTDGETCRFGARKKKEAACGQCLFPPILSSPSLTINRLAGPAETMVCLFSMGGAHIGGLADLSKWSD